MLVHLLAGIKGNNFIIANPLLRQRTSKYDDLKIANVPILLNWCQVMKLGESMGLHKKDINQFFKTTVNDLHLTRSLIHKKKFSPKSARMEMLSTTKLFWKYPMFWLTVAPLYFIPSRVIWGLRKIYRWQREMGGFQWRF
jgi:hypothetical protein